MAHKSLKIALKNDRVERVEELMLRIEKALGAQLIQVGRGVSTANEALELIYEHMEARTLRGRWRGFEKWLGRK